MAGITLHGTKLSGHAHGVELLLRNRALPAFVPAVNAPAPVHA